MLERTVVFFTGQATAWPLTWAGFREGELKSVFPYQGKAWRIRSRLPEGAFIQCQIESLRHYSND